MNPCTTLIDAPIERNMAGDEIDKDEGPDIRFDGFISAEPWAARHNAETWGHLPPELTTNQQK